MAGFSVTRPAALQNCLSAEEASGWGWTAAVHADDRRDRSAPSPFRRSVLCFVCPLCASWSSLSGGNDGYRAGVSLLRTQRHARWTAIMAAWKAAKTTSKSQALSSFNHGGEKPVPRVPARQPPHRPSGQSPYDLLILFPLQRAGGVHQPPARRQRLDRPVQNLPLELPQLVDI